MGADKIIVGTFSFKRFCARRIYHWTMNSIKKAFGRNAQPAAARCRSQRVWEFPTSILRSKNGVCIYRHTACGRYEASQCTLQIWKTFCNRDRPFSSSTWSGRLFFCTKIFEFATAASRASRYHLAIFESDFFKSKFKNTCWASLKPDVQHKNALVLHLNGRWISEFS